MAAAPRWSRLAPERRREQIVETAIRLFGERPYSAVSVTEVARAAGVTRALVHHYFATKRELYREVIQSLLAEGPLVVRTDLGLPMEDMVAANANAALDFAEQNRYTFLAMTQPHGLDRDAELAALNDQAREALVDRILFNHTGTLDHPPEVRVLIRSYLGLFQVATGEWLWYRRATRATTHTLVATTLITLMRETLPALLGRSPPPASMTDGDG